jgi:hypothetical protein
LVPLAQFVPGRCLADCCAAVSCIISERSRYIEFHGDLFPPLAPAWRWGETLDSCHRHPHPSFLLPPPPWGASRLYLVVVGGNGAYSSPGVVDRCGNVPPRLGVVRLPGTTA